MLGGGGPSSFLAGPYGAFGPTAAGTAVPQAIADGPAVDESKEPSPHQPGRVENKLPAAFANKDKAAALPKATSQPRSPQSGDSAAAAGSAGQLPEPPSMFEAMQQAALVQMAIAQQAALEQQVAGAMDPQLQMQLMLHAQSGQAALEEQSLTFQALMAQSFDPQQQAIMAHGIDNQQQAMMAQALQAMEQSTAEDPSQLTAVMAAAREAQQAQYMQQAQFYQQLREEDAAKSKAKVGRLGAESWGDGEDDSRFKGNFRPLRLCKHYTTAGCWRGADCTYAHNLDELHPASPDIPRHNLGTSALAETGKVEESQIPDVRMKKKREMCHKFQNNECVLGRACPFAHAESELGTIELVITDKVKTRICKFWESGKCIFAQNCVNAHGEKEIGTKRPAFMTPPMKKRRADESVEDFRASVLAKPSGRDYAAKVLPPRREMNGGKDD